ncbi:MAG: [ribosomal protein S5]-alanine N-acetyltransferase [Actinomycetota bacterium]|jgi:RimJ/RimL family protein N-acetyltransferase|nr:[ribosomal protein S5]-alanine N-acetyltransferase [Actinomycetota bacterium]
MGSVISKSSLTTINTSTSPLLPITVQPAPNLPITVKPGGVQGFSAGELLDLEGKTIELRSLTPADYEAYKAAIERNADRLAPATGSMDAVMSIIQSAEAFEAVWQLSEQARLFGTDFSFGVFEGDELIGEVGLNAVRRGPFESAFLSAWIDKAHVGQSKVEEAFVLLCRFGFETLGLNRIECAVLPENDAVQHALKKVGVESEGVAREYLMSDGEFKDHRRYVITASDWKDRGAHLLSEWAGL